MTANNAAGNNLTYLANETPKYDAEDRLTEIAQSTPPGYTFSYDGDGWKVSHKRLPVNFAGVGLDECRSERVLSNHVDKLAGFSGGKLGTTVVEESQIGSRVLEVAVPQDAVSGAQQAVLNRVAARAAQQGVKVVFVPIR